MPKANAKLMRSALKEALELLEHEYCFADGTIIISGQPSVGAAWFMSCRSALGLDPITGKRKPPEECEHIWRVANCPSCIRKRLGPHIAPRHAGQGEGQWKK